LIFLIWYKPEKILIDLRQKNHPIKINMNERKEQNIEKKII